MAPTRKITDLPNLPEPGEEVQDLPNVQLYRLEIGTVYKCLFCMKTFTKKADMRRHVRTHTGEKPYKCPYCSQRANHKSNLKKHILMMHRLEPSGGSVLQ